MTIPKYSEEQKKIVAGWLFVGIMPQWVMKYGRNVETATDAMKSARKAVEDLDKSGQLEPLVLAFSSEGKKI